MDNYKVTIIFDDEDNLAGARPTVLGTVLQNATTKKQLALNAASNKPLKSPTVVTFKDVPRYNDNKTLAIWEVKPGRVGNVAYDITLEETGEREYTVTYHLEHVYRDKTVSVNWVGGDESTRPEIQVQLVSQKGSIYNPVAQG